MRSGLARRHRGSVEVSVSARQRPAVARWRQVGMCRAQHLRRGRVGRQQSLHRQAGQGQVVRRAEHGHRGQEAQHALAQVQHQGQGHAGGVGQAVVTVVDRGLAARVVGWQRQGGQFVVQGL
jgi:hypothetical protein